jgi:hypothetical protein
MLSPFPNRFLSHFVINNDLSFSSKDDYNLYSFKGRTLYSQAPTNTLLLMSIKTFHLKILFDSSIVAPALLKGSKAEFLKKVFYLM